MLCQRDWLSSRQGRGGDAHGGRIPRGRSVFRVPGARLTRKEGEGPCRLGLLQETLNALPGLFGGPVMVPDLLGADDPLTVDQHRDGKPNESVRASDLHVGIEQHWEGQSKLLHEVSDLPLRIWLDVDR